METWWIYEMPSAQAAFDAVSALDLNFGHDAHVAFGFVSREELFVRDYLFVYVLVSDPLNRDMSGVDDLLTRFGIPRDLTIDELLDEEGLHLMSTGPAETTLGFLVERFPGEIEVRLVGGRSRGLLDRQTKRP